MPYSLTSISNRVLEATTAHIFVMDRSGVYLYVTPSVARSIGKSPEEMIGHTWREVGLDPEAMSVVERIRDEVLTTGGTVNYEVWSPTARRQFQYDASPLVEGGETVAVVFTMIDITDRKRAEQILVQSNQLLRYIVENSQSGVAILDRDMRYLYASRRFFEEYGVKEKDLIGKSHYEVFPDLPQRWHEIHRRVLAGEVLSAEDDPYHREDGTIDWTTWECRPWYEADGSIGGMVMYAEVVNERKRTEEALREERDRLSSLLNSMSDEVWYVNAAGNLVLVNDAVLEQFGLPPGSTGESVEKIASHYEVYRRDGSLRPLEEAAPLRALRGEVVRQEEEIVRTPATGELRYRQINAAPVTSSNNVIVGSVSVVRDITERVRMEEELRRSNAELQEFAYVTTHDLREPLRMISSYLELLEHKYMGKVLDTKADEYIRFAVDGAVRMQRMVDDLLAYSRIDAKGKEFTSVDMNEVMCTVVNNLEIAILESDAHVSYDDLPTVKADSSQMVALMQNLVDNAIRYRGSEPPRIEVTAERRGNEWQLSVRDNGVGIPGDIREKVFLMFHRGFSHEEKPGSGIGLAVAKKIVERHGGRIWVESKEGKGSTFCFTIPEARGDGGKTKIAYG